MEYKMKSFIVLSVIALAAVSASTASSQESEKASNSLVQVLLENIQAEMEAIPEDSQESAIRIVETILELVELSKEDFSDIQVRLADILTQFGNASHQRSLRLVRSFKNIIGKRVIKAGVLRKRII